MFQFFLKTSKVFFVVLISVVFLAACGSKENVPSDISVDTPVVVNEDEKDVAIEESISDVVESADMSEVDPSLPDESDNEVVEKYIDPEAGLEIPFLGSISDEEMKALEVAGSGSGSTNSDIEANSEVGIVDYDGPTE